jgi:hypothetical protein
MSQILSYRYFGLHVKYPPFLSEFNETLIFSADFLNILKCQISCKSVQQEPSLFHADGQTSVMKLIVAFRNLRTRIKTESDGTLPLLFKRGCQLCNGATENIPSSGVRRIVLIYLLICIHDVRIL